MRTTIHEVRKTIAEALMPGSWIENVLELAREDLTDAEGADIMFVQQRIGTLLMVMGLNQLQRHRIVDYYWEVCRKHSSTTITSAWRADFIRELRTIEAHVPKPNPVNLVVSRNAKGKFQYEPVRVSVKDYLTGEIEHTIEEQPDAVWVFNPETLALKRVATYYDVMNKRLRCARLRDIESGNI